jgi:hypothetical protein
MATNLLLWIAELELMHDRVQADMVKEDDYQHGYLHGMRAAIDHLKEKIEDDED